MHQVARKGENMRQEKHRKYATQFMNYNQADSYYIEVYTNVKRVIKLEARTEEEAIKKALKMFILSFISCFFEQVMGLAYCNEIFFPRVY